MAISILSNELTAGVQRNLNKSNDQFATTMKRVASGNRIVQASDDPAGLAISDSLNATVRSMGQAVRNSQDGMSLMQVYEGGTNEISNSLIRIRELAMEASSDTVGDRERAMLNNESSELLKEITRIAQSTQYQGSTLLDGSKVDLEFQVGPNNNGDVDRIRFAPGNSDLTASGLGVNGLDVLSKDNAQGALETIDSALNNLSEVRARVGSAQSRLHTTIQTQQIYMENLSAAKSRISDADVAVESSNLASQSILRQAGAAVLAQANQSPALALQLLRG